MQKKFLRPFPGGLVSMAMEITALWSEYQRPLASFLARRVRRPSDVDDLLQEVFLRIHRHLDSLEHSDHVAGWIFKTARNALIDHERARATRGEARQVAPDTLDNLAAGENDAPEASEVASCCVRPMIARLPEPYREGIRMTELEGITQAAAAERAGMSLPGMKSRIQRGRERLKELILSCCQIELDVRGGIIDVECGCAAK
jgi:RNA polymerase sigma-70 factor, ECF subfamily